MAKKQKTEESPNDYFIIDCEAHLFPNYTVEELSYMPDVKAFAYAHVMCKHWWRTDHTTGECPEEPDEWTPEALIEDMDAAGIDMACALRECFMDLSGGASPFSTNGYVKKAMDKYPDRIIGQSNVGPILKRGVGNAIKELEILHKELGFKVTKLYAPEDGPINHPDLWPFYRKCQEMEIPVFIHLGLTVRIGMNKYCLPILLDDICTDFPELKVVAFHHGYPYNEEVDILAWKHPNLYIGLSGILGWLYHAPVKLQHIIGHTMTIVGPDRFVFGTDWPATDPVQSVQAILNLEMPEEMQDGWGYPPITKEVKAKIFGENLAKMIGIDPKKAKIDFSKKKIVKRDMAARRGKFREALGLRES
ncbi:MAG: amidohydrolase family protein [Nitrospinota bacterium]